MESTPIQIANTLQRYFGLENGIKYAETIGINNTVGGQKYREVAKILKMRLPGSMQEDIELSLPGNRRKG